MANRGGELRVAKPREEEPAFLAELREKKVSAAARALISDLHEGKRKFVQLRFGSKKRADDATQILEKHGFSVKRSEITEAGKKLYVLDITRTKTPKARKPAARATTAPQKRTKAKEQPAISQEVEVQPRENVIRATLIPEEPISRADWRWGAGSLAPQFPIVAGAFLANGKNAHRYPLTEGEFSPQYLELWRKRSGIKKADQQRIVQETIDATRDLSPSEINALRFGAAYGGYAYDRSVVLPTLSRHYAFLKGYVQQQNGGDVVQFLRETYGEEIGNAIMDLAQQLKEIADANPRMRDKPQPKDLALAIVATSLAETTPYREGQEVEFFDLYKKALRGDVENELSWDLLVGQNPHIRDEVKQNIRARTVLPGAVLHEGEWRPGFLVIDFTPEGPAFSLAVIENNKPVVVQSDLSVDDVNDLYRREDGRESNIAVEGGVVRLPVGFTTETVLINTTNDKRVGRYRVSFNPLEPSGLGIAYASFEAVRGVDDFTVFNENARVAVGRASYGPWQNSITERDEEGRRVPVEVEIEVIPPPIEETPPQPAPQEKLAPAVGLQLVPNDIGRPLEFRGWDDEDGEKPPARVRTISLSALGFENIDLNDPQQVVALQVKLLELMREGKLPFQFYRRISLKDKDGNEVGSIPVGKPVQRENGEVEILSVPAVFINRGGRWYRIEARDVEGNPLDIQQALRDERQVTGETPHYKYSIIGIDETSLFKYTEDGNLVPNEVRVEDGKLLVGNEVLSKDGVVFTMEEVEQPTYDDVSHPLAFSETIAGQRMPFSYVVVKKGDDYIAYYYNQEDGKVSAIVLTESSIPEGLADLISDLEDGVHFIVSPLSETYGDISTAMTYHVVPPVNTPLIGGPYLLDIPAENLENSITDVIGFKQKAAEKSEESKKGGE